MTRDQAHVEIEHLVARAKNERGYDYKENWRYDYAILCAEGHALRWYSLGWLLGLFAVFVVIPLLRLIGDLREPKPD